MKNARIHPRKQGRMGLSEKCFTYVLPSLKKTKPDFLKSPVCQVGGQMEVSDQIYLDLFKIVDFA
jgi:hypothetical protein